jgi:hypothetical protein
MLVSVALALALVVPALGQTVVVDAAGAASGKYWIEVRVENGQVTAEVVPNGQIIVLADGDTGGPVDPESSLAKVSLKAKDLVTDVKKDANSVKLSAVYEALAREIGDKFTHEGGEAPWQKLANATKVIRATILGESADNWQPWMDAIGKALSAMEEANKLDDDAAMQQAYRDIAQGLVADLSREDISPETWQMIIEIIRMLLELFLEGGLGG